MTSGNLPIAAVSDQAVRQLAQSDPVPNLTARWGELAEDVRREVSVLKNRLRELDKVQGQLADHNITVEVDLGPIGNAAAAARRDLERDTGKKPFEMPRVPPVSERF